MLSHAHCLHQDDLFRLRIRETVSCLAHERLFFLLVSFAVARQTHDAQKNREKEKPVDGARKGEKNPFQLFLFSNRGIHIYIYIRVFFVTSSQTRKRTEPPPFLVTILYLYSLVSVVISSLSSRVQSTRFLLFSVLIWQARVGSFCRGEIVSRDA